MAAFPISLIPTFFVPLFILVHLLIFRSRRSRSIGLALNRRLAEGRMNPWRSSQHGAPNDIVVAMRKPGILLPAYDRETASLAGRTFRIRHRHNAVDEASDALNEASMERTTTTFLDLRRMVLRLSRSQLPRLRGARRRSHLVRDLRLRLARHSAAWRPRQRRQLGISSAGAGRLLDVAFCLLTAAAMAAIRAILGASPTR